MSTNSDRLIFLSLGRVSRVMSMGTDGTDLQTLAEGLESAPDGVAVDPVGRHIFISYMGLVRVGEDYWENDGHVERCNYDGSAAKAFAGRDRIPGVQVAGKTGTLSTTEPFYMQYSWFVGFAKTTKPSLSIAVLLGNPELWQIKAHTAARMVLIEALKSRAGS